MLLEHAAKVPDLAIMIQNLDFSSNFEPLILAGYAMGLRNLLHGLCLSYGLSLAHEHGRPQ